MSGKQITSSGKRLQAHSLPPERSDDEFASATDISDDGENEIDSVKYLIILQKIREETQKASQANFKRQFATFSAEIRGHASAMVEDMNAYIDKLGFDTLDTQDREGISAQAVVDAVLEWKTQLSKANEARVIYLSDNQDIRREDEVNQVSKLIEVTALQRAQAHSRLLRKVKIEIERLREQEKVVTDAKTLVKRYKKLLGRR